MTFQVIVTNFQDFTGHYKQLFKGFQGLRNHDKHKEHEQFLHKNYTENNARLD